MVSNFLTGARNPGKKTSDPPEAEIDRTKMENSQIAPVINLPELNEQQKEELCQQIEHLRSEHLTLTEKLYGEQDIIDPFFMDHLERFIKIYNVMIKICGRRDDLPIPELELRPSVEWIRRILYPDNHHPDNLPDDGSSSGI